MGIFLKKIGKPERVKNFIEKFTEKLSKEERILTELFPLIFLNFKLLIKFSFPLIIPQKYST
jgi:hypothetical protein